MQLKKDDEWITKILPGNKNSYFVNDMEVDNIAVGGVSRYGIEGETVVVDVEE